MAKNTHSTRPPQRGSTNVQSSRAPQRQQPAPQQRQQTGGTAVATRSAGAPPVPSDLTAQLPVEVQGLLRERAGQGISNRQEDNIVPLVYLLQPLSPQVLPGSDKTLPGAKAGDIWLRNAPADQCIVPSDEGLVFQSCHFQTAWIEWLPNRGGFVQRYRERPAAAQLQEEESEDGQTRNVWRMPNGNLVQEYREHAGHVVHPDGTWEPYVISLSGTGHTVSRSWMTSMRRMRFSDGTQIPSYAFLWRLTPKLRSKNNRNWFMYEVAAEGPATAELIRQGATLCDAFESGEKEAAAMEGDTEGEAADDNIGDHV